MIKAQLLRENLLGSTALDLKGTDVLLSVTDGQLISEVGDANASFQVNYIADLTLLNFSGQDDVLFFVIRQWLDQVQPMRDSKAFTFETDVLDNGRVDVNIRIPLREVVKVSQTADGVSLLHVDEPQMETMIPGVKLQLSAVDALNGETWPL